MTASPTTTTPDARYVFREATTLFPWLPRELINIYVEEYVESGDATLAWAQVRSSKAYDRYFPGMKREDGSLRLTDEQSYFAVMESYRDVFRSIGVAPGIFERNYVRWLEGEVSPDEAAARVNPVFERVIQATPEIQQWWLRDQGRRDNMTPQAFLVGVLDPDMGQQLIDRQITIAEIGGEAQSSGFRIGRAFAEELATEGLERGTANQLFAQAALDMPILNVLQQRHDDPDDPFTIEEFVSANLYADPDERRHIQRLVANERALFANTTQLQYRRDQELGVTGLAAR